MRFLALVGVVAMVAAAVGCKEPVKAKAPAAKTAHPRTEHWAPLYVTLGASLDAPGTVEAPIDGFWMGLSKRSFQMN